MNHRLRSFLWGVLAGLIVWGVIVQIQASSFNFQCRTQPAGCGKLENPILSVELARSSEAFEEIINWGDRSLNIHVVRKNTHMDFLFIFLYWLLFVLFARYYNNRWSRLVVVFISAAALCDLLENWRILACLRGPGLTPAVFGYPKWAFFGAALIMLGLLIRAPSEKRHPLLAWMLIIAGVLFLAGLPVKFLMPAMGFAGLAMLLALVLYFPFPVDTTLAFLEYAYLIRFQIIFALLLAIVLPLFYWVIPSVFVGLFDAVSRTSLALVVWAAFQLAWIVMVTSRLVLVYGGERFPGVQSLTIGNVKTRTVVFFGLLAVPFIFVLCLGTLDLRASQKATSIVIGLAAAVLGLFLIAKFHFFIEDDSGHTANQVFPSFGVLQHTQDKSRSRFWAFVDGLVAKLPTKLQGGLLRDGRLRSGHQLAAIALAGLLFCYVTLGVVYLPQWVSPKQQPAAVLYLLLLFSILLWMLAGVSFFLDVLRLPVLTTLLAFSLLTGMVRTDHEFEISGHSGVEPLPPQTVIEKWAESYRQRSRPQGANPKYAIIVATAGGGIRAAAWTAKVMTGLQGQCGDEFSSSLLLVSSVSGGSVGAMSVLSAYDSSDRSFHKSATELADIRAAADRSSLSAVGWGLLYPDLSRTVPFLGPLVPQRIDRGWALENAWISGWKNPPNMSDWRAEVARGTRPAVIFNATGAEDGKRFIIASADFDPDEDHALRFFRDFPVFDLPVSTAARLSASFPYVSPQARASQGSDLFRVHVGDGGYYDNSGILSALEWLKEAKPALSNYQVLFITIDAGPTPPKLTKPWSWQRQATAPVETLLSVRTSSQLDRDDLELRLEQDVFGSGWVQRPVHFLYVAGKDNGGKSITYSLQPDESSPLSWHLNKLQIQRIDESWSTADNVGAAQEVCSILQGGK